MICPKCRNEVSTKWCKYCGTQIETDVYTVPSYEDTDKDLKSADLPVSKKTNTSAMILIVIAVIIALVLAVAVFSSRSQKKAETAVNTVQSSAQNKEPDDSELIDKATRYMDAGNYSSAEQICKEAIDSYNSDKATEMYRILYNYNNAVKEISEYKYKAARKSFDKIPDKYCDYSICHDVDALDDEITGVQVAYEILDNVTSFINSGNYADAYSEVNVIDTDKLKPDDRTIVEEYKKEISKNYSPDIKKKDPSGTGDVDISMHDAEDLIHGYCDALVKAIQSRNFDIVAKYMHPDSKLYARQKNTVNTYISEGTTKRLDSFYLDTITQTGKNKWDAMVREGETIYFANGFKQQYNHAWTYTIEYIDSAFYLTDLK